MTVEAPGFGKAEAKDVSVTVGGLVDLPVALALASGSEVVEVTSQADLVETSRTSTTDTIGQRRIDNLPINGRNYINFTLDGFPSGARQRAEHWRRTYVGPEHERTARRAPIW